MRARGNGAAEEAPALGQRRDEGEQRVVARLRIGGVVGRGAAAEVGDVAAGVVLAHDQPAAVADAVAARRAVAEGADELHAAAQVVDDRVAAGLAEQQAGVQPVRSSSSPGQTSASGTSATPSRRSAAATACHSRSTAGRSASYIGSEASVVGVVVMAAAAAVGREAGRRRGAGGRAS